MCRQLAKAITAWPKKGARIGTIMNTIMVSDMTRAMAGPWKRSRTIETTSTRLAAAATPCIARAASSQAKLEASPASVAKTA